MEKIEVDFLEALNFTVSVIRSIAVQLSDNISEGGWCLQSDLARLSQ